MTEGTRFGTTMHSPKVVQGSDAYPLIMDGKIKRVAPLPSPGAERLSARCFLSGFLQLPEKDELALEAISSLYSTLRAPSVDDTLR
jgi:hypothetical protein